MNIHNINPPPKFNKVKKNLTKSEWDYISRNYKLTEDFMQKHKNKLNWLYISSCQTLDEPFIEKCFDNISWEFIAISQNLSEDFLLNLLYILAFSSAIITIFTYIFFIAHLIAPLL